MAKSNKILFHRYLCRNCGHIHLRKEGGECFLCKACQSDKIEQMTDKYMTNESASLKEAHNG